MEHYMLLIISSIEIFNVIFVRHWLAYITKLE